jgi:hypothetical protein
MSDYAFLRLGTFESAFLVLALCLSGCGSRDSASKKGHVNSAPPIGASNDPRIILKCDLRATTVGRDSRGAQFDERSADESQQYYRIDDANHGMEYWGSRGFLPMCTPSMGVCSLDLSSSFIKINTLERGSHVSSETRDTMNINRLSGNLAEDWIFKIQGTDSSHTTIINIRGTCKNR